MDQQLQDLSGILAEYRGRIYRLALSILHNQVDAEDVLQSTSVKIVDSLSGFQKRSQLSTWIYRVAYNESLIYLRKKRRLFHAVAEYKKYLKTFPVRFKLSWKDLPDKTLLDKELKQRIESAFKNLPIHYRMPVLLHTVEGLSLDQAASVLRLKTATVKTRLHRAFLMLRKEIDDYFKDKPEHHYPRQSRCGRWTRFVFDYARKNLGQARKRAFEAHIKDCPECKVFLDSYLGAIRITSALECRDVPPRLKVLIDKVVARIKNNEITKKKRMYS